jgi:hypothetical protein
MWVNEIFEGRQKKGGGAIPHAFSSVAGTTVQVL